MADFCIYIMVSNLESRWCCMLTRTRHVRACQHRIFVYIFCGRDFTSRDRGWPHLHNIPLHTCAFFSQDCRLACLHSLVDALCVTLDATIITVLHLSSHIRSQRSACFARSLLSKLYLAYWTFYTLHPARSRTSSSP